MLALPNFRLCNLKAPPLDTTASELVACAKELTSTSDHSMGFSSNSALLCTPPLWSLTVVAAARVNTNRLQ